MSETDTHADTWFLQGDEGTVYGPVDSATLKDWCLEGRIEPDNILSTDRENWLEAADVPELEMDWLVLQDDDTRCGPFNLELVPGLIDNGIIPADAVLENRHTGEKRPAGHPDHEKPPLPETEAEVESQTESPTAESDVEQPPSSSTENEEKTEAPPFDDSEPDKQPEPAPAEDPVDETDDNPDIVTQEQEDEPLSKRLEPLQRSATEARQQLVETRQALQDLQTAHTVLKDEYQRLKDDLAASTEAQQQGEQQLLEQQDRAAAAETEAENLQAQLEQMKDHYDRLQLENQNQFEKIDDLQATQLLNEQRFKRELTELSDRADAKTELLAGTVKLLMQDEDLATRMKTLSVASRADNQTEEQLTATIKKLEQQLETERQQAKHEPHETVEGKGRTPLATLLLFATGVLLGALLIALNPKGCKTTAEEPQPAQTNAPAESPTLQPAPETDAFPLETTEGLDLQPDVSAQHDTSNATSNPRPPTSINWPALSLPSATITVGSDSLQVVFNQGLFSVATRLTPEAVSALNKLADQLHGNMDSLQLMIEGHTDATPIAAAGSRYVDNFALGMARAEAIKTFLTQTGKIPADSMRTSSAGESSPPFSNDNEVDRKRNRTAVLTLVKP